MIEDIMLLNLTDLSAEPLQQQIVRQIRSKILSGELITGADLPSIRGLARDYHVSVITVQRAYELLVRDGLILSRRGKGFFVAELTKDGKKEMARQRLRDNLEPILFEALADGLSPADVEDIIEKIISDHIESDREE